MLIYVCMSVFGAALSLVFPSSCALPSSWPSMSRHPKPSLDFSAFEAYVATVLCSRCPGYSAPHGRGGHKVGEPYPKHSRVSVVATEDCGEYVSALTVGGTWINVWTLRNLGGAPVGVNFCSLAPRPADA